MNQSMIKDMLWNKSYAMTWLVFFGISSISSGVIGVLFAAMAGLAFSLIAMFMGIDVDKCEKCFEFLGGTYFVIVWAIVSYITFCIVVRKMIADHAVATP